MKIKTVIVILISLFLALSVFLGYVFFISRTENKSSGLKTDLGIIEGDDSEQKVDPIKAEENRQIIINNLVRGAQAELEDKNIGEVNESEVKEAQEEKEKKVSDIKKLLLE